MTPLHRSTLPASEPVRHHMHGLASEVPNRSNTGANDFIFFRHPHEYGGDLPRDVQIRTSKAFEVL